MVLRSFDCSCHISNKPGQLGDSSAVTEVMDVGWCDIFQLHIFLPALSRRQMFAEMLRCELLSSVQQLSRTFTWNAFHRLIIIIRWNQLGLFADCAVYLFPNITLGRFQLDLWLTLPLICQRNLPTRHGGQDCIDLEKSLFSQSMDEIFGKIFFFICFFHVFKRTLE